MNDKYLEAVRTLEELYQTTDALSDELGKLGSVTWQQRLASILFAKICMTTTAILKLLPESKYCVKVDNLLIWDISSTCSLTRDLIDCYRAFHYLVGQGIDENELNLRLLVWELHSEERRFEMLELIYTSKTQVHTEFSDKITLVKEKIERLRKEIQDNEFFRKSDVETQKKCLSVKDPYYLSHQKISESAGIDHGYYKSVYIFLSTYVHTLPFSIFQLNILRAGSDELLGIFKDALDHCIAFLCLTIRDFKKIFPDQANIVSKNVMDLIKIWESVVKNIVKSQEIVQV